MSIFTERKNYKPFEYGHITTPLINAMWASHWTHNEFNFIKDIQDYKVEITEEERGVIKRAILLTSQIEVAVKSYWGNIGKLLPKPEIADMGAVFGGVEVIHSRAYSEILERLGLNEEFKEMLSEEIVQNRVTYLSKYVNKIYKNDRKNILYSLVLFTIFTEATSLFSQFYTILGFNRFRNLFKDISNIVQYTSKEENCVIEGTEILTPKGWADFRDLDSNSKVYGFSEGVLKIEKPFRLVKNKFKGDLVKIGNNRHSAIVTPNHEMISYRNHSGWSKETAEKISLNTGNYIPVTVELYGNKESSKMSDEDRLKIAIQADGYYIPIINSQGENKLKGDCGGCNVFFSIKKQRKKDRLELLLNNTDIKYIKREDNKGYTHYSIKFGRGVDYKTLKWVNFENISKTWAEDFIDELLKWDGSTKNGVKVYSSSEKNNIDIAQHVGVLAGYRTKIIKGKESKRNPNYRDNYRLQFTNKDSKLTRAHSYKKEFLKYEGNVYCVTVPSGGIITRYNGEVFIIGNCHMEGGVALINQIKEEHPELFDEEFKNKICEEIKEAFDSESKLIDWILRGYENEFLSEDILKKYVKYRLNECLNRIGVSKPYKLRQSDIDSFIWMEEEVLASATTDFFHKKPIDYAKKNKTFNEEELF